MPQAYAFMAAARRDKGGVHQYTVQCGMEHVSVYPRPAATDSDAEKSHAFYVTKSALHCSSAKYKFRRPSSSQTRWWMSGI